jgi:hypothetical protein
MQVVFQKFKNLWNLPIHIVDDCTTSIPESVKFLFL